MASATHWPVENHNIIALAPVVSSRVSHGIVLLETPHHSKTG
jgi:hypothetical protein